MIRRPPRSTRTDTLFPDTTLFRSAAHAGCYSMALSMVLSAAGFPPRRIKTSALVHISPSADGFSIPRIELVTEGDVPGIDLAAFSAHAETATLGCPVRSGERRVGKEGGSTWRSRWVELH